MVTWPLLVILIGRPPDLILTSKSNHRPCVPSTPAPRDPGHTLTNGGSSRRPGAVGRCASYQLLASGFPFIFGFTCYSNLPFQTTTGEIPLPGAQDQVI